MLQGAQQFIFDDGPCTLDEIDRAIEGLELGKPERSSSLLMAWRCGTNRQNILRMRVADQWGLPTMPVRFDLGRELAVLGNMRIVRQFEPNWALVDAPHLTPALERCSYLNLSSGTSATRTIAFPTHEQLFENARSCNEAFGLSHRRWYWCTFPFFAHAHELISKSIAADIPLLNCAPTAVSRINTILNEQPIELHILTTPHVATSFLSKHLDVADPSRIRFELAGEYVSLGVVNRLRAKGFKAAVSWGSAETSGVAMADLHPQVAGSIGKPLPRYQVTPDQICDRAPLTIAGPAIPSYLFRNHQLNATHGHFVSKDEVGYDGHNLIFRGRSDKQIKFKGTYINVTEVESWAKNFDEVDNAFLTVEDTPNQTELRLYVQCEQKSLWPEIESVIKSRMFQTYGGIRIHVLSRVALSHTPTGKLIREASQQTQPFQPSGA